MRVALQLCHLLFASVCSFGAGVWKGAGSGFDASAQGKPITWRNGVLHYRTDQGDFSTSITVPQADAAIAWALQQWTQIPTGAVSAVMDGKLAEDINVGNTDAANGQLVLPPDAQAANGGERLIVIYDFDGSIVDAMRGPGASDPSSCSTNAAIYWADGYAHDGYFAHSVLLLNGNCFASANQLKYTLLRVTGRLLGLGWSQVNDNVVTSPGSATAADWNGWPILHAVEGWCFANCVL
ncbi:MAG: hypothetical protein NVS9B15_11520 [Acidobacteriaceae bacterium]